MKVYFEESGFGCDGKGNNTVGINIYVNPDGNGSAYHYDKLGELCCFSWVYPDEARVIESDVLPDDLWYSITHGVDHADVPQSLSKYKWNIDDLVYTKVNKAKVEAYKKVVDALPSVKTIEDFKQIYPFIKESGTISGLIIDKLFGLMDIKRTEVRNGEIGIAFAHDLTIYEQCIYKIFSKEIVIKFNIHTIDETPDHTPNNPYVGVLFETSIFPQFILAQDYKDFVKQWADPEKHDRGCLIGWFYAAELLPDEERRQLIHISAENNYYKDIKL